MPRLAGFHVSRIVLWITAALLIGFTISTALAWRQLQRNHNEARTAVAQATEDVAADVIAAMQLYQYGLRGARGVVLTAGEDNITLAQFVRYSQSRDLAVEFPGAEGFGFVRRVPQNQEDAFVQRMRKDGRPMKASDTSFNTLSRCRQTRRRWGWILHLGLTGARQRKPRSKPASQP